MSPYRFEVQYDEPFEAFWEWVREEVTANTCFGTTIKVCEKVNVFFAGLAERATEVMQRCKLKRIACSSPNVCCGLP